MKGRQIVPAKRLYVKSRNLSVKRERVSGLRNKKKVGIVKKKIIHKGKLVLLFT